MPEKFGIVSRRATRPKKTLDIVPRSGSGQASWRNEKNQESTSSRLMQNHSVSNSESFCCDFALRLPKV